MLHVRVCWFPDEQGHGAQVSAPLPVFDGGPETVSSVFMIRSFSLYDPCFRLHVEQDVKKGWRNCSSRMQTRSVMMSRSHLRAFDDAWWISAGDNEGGLQRSRGQEHYTS